MHSDQGIVSLLRVVLGARGYGRFTLSEGLPAAAKCGVIPREFAQDPRGLMKTALAQDDLRITDAERETARLYAEGLDLAEIEARCGVSRTVIRKRVIDVLREFILWSALDHEIYDLPVKIRNALVQSGYTSADALRRASVNQLRQVSGIGKQAISFLVGQGLLGGEER